MSDAPQSGDVFDYYYLWAREQAKGEESGRKERPTCVVLAIPTATGGIALRLLPLTTKEPTDAAAIEIPQTERARVGLDAARRQWLILSEWNADVYETSTDFADRTPRGVFSKAFMKRVYAAMLPLLEGRRIAETRRQ